MSKLPWVSLACAGLPLCMLLAGCQDPAGSDGRTPGQNLLQPRTGKAGPPDVVGTVVGVIAYYDSFNPWLWNESKTRPIGVDVKALYLEGPSVKGVFGDGVIRPRMYVNEPAAGGESEWKLAKEWSFDVDQAREWRSRKETAQGWGYRIPLPWEDLDLSGREIRMIILFQRSDGKTVSSAKKDFRVPGAPRASH